MLVLDLAKALKRVCFPGVREWATLQFSQEDFESVVWLLRSPEQGTV